MRKPVRASAVLDKLHKSVVIACLGITTYGCYLLGWRFYRYFTVLRPDQKQQELVAKEELLAEGTATNLFNEAQKLK